MANTLSTHRGIAILGATGVSRMIDSADVLNLTGDFAKTNRNMVINGGMDISQRGTSGFTIGAAVNYGIDMFSTYKDQTSATFAYTQEFLDSAETGSLAPRQAGITRYAKITNTGTDASLGATDRMLFVHRIEGRRMAHLLWGSANAKNAKLSFYVNSSVTGTHGGAIGNGNDTRSYPFTYTVNSADTWERKEVTITGDTAQENKWTHAFTDDRGAQIVFGLGVGSTYSTTAGAWADGDYNSATGATAGVMSTSSATWKITGIQFEAGDTMTPFEFLDRKEVLDDCLRYFYRCHRNQNYGEFALLRTYSTSNGTGDFPLPVPMRANPTLAVNVTVNGTNFGYGLTSISIGSSDVETHGHTYLLAVGAFTANGAAVIQKMNDTNSIYLDFHAEM